MKFRFIFLFVCLGIFATGMGAQHVVAAPAAQQNLFQNPGFEQGTILWGGLPNAEVPSGWDYWHATATSADAQSANWQQPETRMVSDITHGGSKAMHAIGYSRPVWFSLSQSLYGLTPGAEYLFSVWVKSENQSAEHRLKINEPTMKIQDSGYQLSETGWRQISVNFVPGSSQVTLTMELRSRQAQEWWVDDMSLVATGRTTAVPTRSVFSAPVGAAAPAAAAPAVPQPTPDFGPTAVPAAQLTAQANGNPTPDNALYAAQLAATRQAADGVLVSAPIVPTAFKVPEPSADGKIYYVVQSGDSLIRLASLVCGPTIACVEALKTLNNMGPNDNVLDLDEEIIIGPIAGREYYIVEPGDTLVSIAIQVCGETVECLQRLQDLNNIDGNLIYAGQQLITSSLADEEGTTAADLLIYAETVEGEIEPAEEVEEVVEEAEPVVEDATPEPETESGLTEADVRATSLAEASFTEDAAAEAADADAATATLPINVPWWLSFGLLMLGFVFGAGVTYTLLNIRNGGGNDDDDTPQAPNPDDILPTESMHVTSDSTMHTPIVTMTKSPKYDIILFDMAGVLVRFEGVKHLTQFTQTPVSEEKLWERWLHSPAVHQFDSGLIPVEEFARRVVKDLHLTITSDEFLAQMEGWLQGAYEGAEDLLIALKDTYRLGALTNMNVVYWPMIENDTNLTNYFEVIFASHEMGTVKPDPKIYRRVIELLDVDPRRVLFIDDNKLNVDAARDAGLSAFQAKEPTGAAQLLRDLGIL